MGLKDEVMQLLREQDVPGLARLLVVERRAVRHLLGRLWDADEAVRGTAARALGFDRDASARVSFLLSVPVIAGAVVLKVGGLLADGVPEGMGGALIVGVITSGISGWVAVWGTLWLVRTHNFTPFVVYRIALGVAVLAIVATGWR